VSRRLPSWDEAQRRAERNAAPTLTWDDAWHAAVRGRMPQYIREIIDRKPGWSDAGRCEGALDRLYDDAGLSDRERYVHHFYLRRKAAGGATSMAALGAALGMKKQTVSATLQRAMQKLADHVSALTGRRYADCLYRPGDVHTGALDREEFKVFSSSGEGHYRVVAEGRKPRTTDN
jgi:DNA-binding CsgD family transcriptional regulator